LHPPRDTTVVQCFLARTSRMADYAGLGDPRQGKKRGKELLSARDQIQDDIMKDACWCVYLYYGGCGCINPFEKGCCLAIGEVCCCAGTCKSATCCDGDGCIAATIKCCCSLFHGEIPPSNTPGCGFGPLMCGGNLDRDPSELSAMEKEELEMLKTTCWCFFAYCLGFGCNSPGGSDPCCKVEGKLCCLWSNLETDSCCDDGWIENTTKVCCCVFDASCPAGRTPGLVCCTFPICGANGMESTEKPEN